MAVVGKNKKNIIFFQLKSFNLYNLGNLFIKWACFRNAIQRHFHRCIMMSQSNACLTWVIRQKWQLSTMHQGPTNYSTPNNNSNPLYMCLLESKFIEIKTFHLTLSPLVLLWPTILPIKSTYIRYLILEMIT